MKKLLFLPLIVVMAFELIAVDPPFGYTARQVYSLFQDERRNEGWDMALIYGRYLINAHPRDMEGVDSYEGHRQFNHMVTVYKEYANNFVEDPDKQQAYMDSALYMFDKVFEHYDEDELDQFRWVFNRGRFYQENSSDLENGMQHAYADYEKLMELDIERITESGDGYYVQIVLDNMKSEGRTDNVLEWIERAEPYANESLKDFFSDLQDELFSDPADRVEWLGQNLEDDPDNTEIMEEMFDLYDELGETENKWDKARRLYETDPSYTSVMRMAELYNDEGDYREGNEYLIESLDYTDDSERRFETKMRLSRNYLNLRDFEDAREFALRASEVKPESGEPYVQIADIYSQTISSCDTGGELGRRDRAVYWLVLDYLDKAKETDPGTERSVDNRYSSYEEVMPSSNDVHFMDQWTSGGSYLIGEETGDCYAWIDEETTVR